MEKILILKKFYYLVKILFMIKVIIIQKMKAILILDNFKNDANIDINSSKINKN